MSLLLEALKKAEKAKEEAQRRANGESQTPAPLQLQEAAPPAEAKHVLTRPELPDISRPLEILSDDITPKAPPGGREPRPPSGAREASQAKPQAAARARPRSLERPRRRPPRGSLSATRNPPGRRRRCAPRRRSSAACRRCSASPSRALHGPRRKCIRKSTPLIPRTWRAT